MRSLLITHDYPPMVGGIATALAAFWREAGNSQCVILAPGVDGAAAFDRRHPIRTVRFAVLSGSGVLVKLANAITGLIAFVYCVVRYRPDVVIAGQIVRSGPAAHIWHKVTGRPFYLWVYGGETRAGFTGLSPLTKHLHRVLNAARLVLSISPYTTQEMLDFGVPSERIVELSLGVREDIRPGPKEPAYVRRFGLDDKLVFLTIGRLIERKGIDTMLEALHGLGDRLPPWHYLIASDGPYRPELERMVGELGLDRAVTFTGYIEEHELPIYYNLCDVFAMPNREVPRKADQSLSVEGFGIVLIEAAACEKPVIAGRSGGAVHAVDDGVNGILVDPTDIKELEAAILRLSDPEVRARMGAAGAEFAAGFRWSTAAAVLSNYLESGR